MCFNEPQLSKYNFFTFVYIECFGPNTIFYIAFLTDNVDIRKEITEKLCSQYVNTYVVYAL